MIKKKNIGIICNYKLNPERIGGMDRFFQAYNKQLLQKGYKLTWFFSGGEQFDFYSGFELHIAGKNESVETNVLHYLKKDQGFDIVVTHFLALCTPFYKELKKRSQPYIIAVDHNPRPPGGFPLKKRLKNRVRGKLFSQFIDCFVGVSKYTVDCILKDYGSNLRKKTEIVYNGIDTSVYLKRNEENHSRFIVASHLRESKGIQDLIEAVKLLPVEIRNTVRIDIFGEGPMEKNLKEMVAAYQLEEQFRFKGSTPNLPQLFKHYSYMLQPTYMECFSLSILESLAANVPVITTPVGGNLEIISHGRNGFIFPTGNRQELSDVLQKILCGEAQISYDVSRLVEEQFNLDRMLENHINLLPCT